MKNKIIFTSIFVMLPFGAFAETPMDMMAKLTEDQKACVTTHGCVVPEQPETTEAMNAYMDCMKNAMVSCDIHTPEAPAPEPIVMDIPAPEVPVMDVPASEAPAPEPIVMDIPAPEAPAPEPIVMDIPAPEAPQE